MFFLKRLEHEITLHPKYFGRKMDEILLQRLHAEVESTCTGRYGYIICVTTVDSVSKGRVMEGTGMATFTIKYRAIVFRPFKGEVLDAIVTQVNQMGFFAEVGPLQVFVSNHLIPGDMTFSTADNIPCYQSSDQTVSLSKDDGVRLKIVGTRIDASEIFAIGTIKEDYLGVIS